jgi:hypothetical protein
VKWATRPGVHVDRTGCAWLIRRFIDAEAEFSFIADIEAVPKGTTPFDMRGAELSHRGGECTFETILRRHGLDDPALWEIGRISTRPTSRTSASTLPRREAWTSSSAGSRWCAPTRRCSSSPDASTTGYTSTSGARRCSAPSLRKKPTGGARAAARARWGPLRPPFRTIECTVSQ